MIGPNALLVVVDVQVGLDDPWYGQRNNPDCERNIARVLAAWRKTGRSIAYTQHFSERPGSPLRAGEPGSALKEDIGPGRDEPIFPKRSNSAFKAEAFAAAVSEAGLEQLVIVGIATDQCVTATAREALDLGYRVLVVHDACATFPRSTPAGTTLCAGSVHDAALASLGAAGAALACTDQAVEAIETSDPAG